MLIKKAVSVFIFSSFFILEGSAFAAETPELHDKANHLFQKIWSPYCPGVSLLECPSGQAQDLRDSLRSRLSEGESEEQIMKTLYQVYGEEKLLMMPENSGRESSAYWLPYLIGILGAVLLVGIFWYRNSVLSKKRQIVSTSTSSPPPLNSKILEDLKERESL